MDTSGDQEENSEAYVQVRVLRVGTEVGHLLRRLGKNVRLWGSR